MRNNSQISKEPLIKVGIILPNDNMSQIDVALSDCDSFEIEHWKKYSHHVKIRIIYLS